MTDSNVNFSDLTTKKDRIAFIREKLGTNPKWAVRGLVRIFENQTDGEQEMGATVEDNGIGFTGADADILTSFVHQFKEREFLSGKQMGILFKKMPKYARQLEGMSVKKESN